MLLFFRIAITIILLMIFVQDMRSRAVYWVLLPLLAIAFIGHYFFAHGSLAGYWQLPIINLAFVLGQLLILTSWFSLKHKRLVNITAGLLGWGDILFLVCLACCFSFLNFMLFYISSLVLVLLVWTFGKPTLFKNTPHIPLAGMQALLLGILLIIVWCRPGPDLTSDERLLNVLMP